MIRIRSMVRALSLLSACTLLAACSHNSRGGTYLVTVRDASSRLFVEGASVEFLPGANERVTGTTDTRGEALLLLPAFGRAELRVGFDGETDRYFVRSADIRPWGGPPPAPAHEEAGALVFLAGHPAGAKPRFDVDLVFVRFEPPR